ncbi:unnamed protein product [Acanthoscelides obtectus]|uniref:Autophagy-related protein 11 C-terminal domain-containing protein n=1 Tax=Acanthoscelides obtectus TaxID=200917 RepID=A0A9P0K398_ACAOB|nr:unnamed protein product [Acanthoscelides obtectus]CAK1629712.1 RB1-inducible coiled-coil protein 1 [Acanthoscelides obtectus]
MSTSVSSSRPTIRASVNQCLIGDLVLVVWDPNHQSFRIAQENRHMYFLNTESLDALGLAVVDGTPNKSYCLGVVLDREYCHARKSKNRYRLPKGTKFFRLKVGPASVAQSSSKDSVTQSLYQPRPPSMSEASRTLSQSTISEITECAPLSLPPSPDARKYPVIPERDESDGASRRKSKSTSSEGDTEAAKQMDIDSWSSEGIEVHRDTPFVLPQNVEVICPVDTDNHFAEDSGIVENIEEAVALEETIVPEEVFEEDAHEGQRDPQNYEHNIDEQHGYVSTTWLEMMLSRVFSKSD